MKAIVQSAYGEPDAVLRLRDVPDPTPGRGEVLVRVRATSVHADVWHVVAGQPYLLRVMGAGLRRPTDRIPGTDLAGIVEAVGGGVTRFAPGDAVFGESQVRMQWKNGGAWAELAVAPEAALAHKPDNVTFEQAATVPTAGYIAVSNLRGDTTIRPSHHVLVNGAGGGVGTIAVQIAKARGAHVTAVDCSTKRTLLETLGADRFIDYQTEDFTRGAERYDLIFDVASTLELRACRRVFTEQGRYVLIGHDHYGSAGRHVFGSMPRMIGLMLRSRFDPHLPTPDFSLPEREPVLEDLRSMLEGGQLTPVIDRAYPLGEASDALRRMQEGLGIGRIVLVP